MTNNNRKGILARFTATAGNNTATEPTGEPVFTADQWATACETLGIDPDSSVDEFLAALTEAVEEDTADNSDGGRVAASAKRPVFIDADVWEEMSNAVKLGMKARHQEKRLQAERVIDQAIRHGKIGTARREDWLLQYQHDPEAVQARLNNMPNDKEPYFELGHGRSAPEEETVGWVRS